MFTLPHNPKKPKPGFFSTSICLDNKTKQKLEQLRSPITGHGSNSKAIARALDLVDPRLDPMNPAFDADLARRYHELIKKRPT